MVDYTTDTNQKRQNPQLFGLETVYLRFAVLHYMAKQVIVSS